MVYSDQSELIDFKPGELAALTDDVKAVVEPQMKIFG